MSGCDRKRRGMSGLMISVARIAWIAPVPYAVVMAGACSDKD